MKISGHESVDFLARKKESLSAPLYEEKKWFLKVVLDLLPQNELI